MKTVYISGPMRGIENYNVPAFYTAAGLLWLYGYKPINPARNFGGDTTLPWETYMQTDIAQVLSADAIALLPGWQNSTGALVELAVALATGKDVMDAETLEPIEGLRLDAYYGSLRISPFSASADVPTSAEKPGGGAAKIVINTGRFTFDSLGEYTPQEAHNIGFENGTTWGASLHDGYPGDDCCDMSEGIDHTCDDCPDLAESARCGDPGDCYGCPLDDDDYVLDDELSDTLSSADVLQSEVDAALSDEEFIQARDNMVAAILDRFDLKATPTSKIDTGRGGSRSVLEEAIDITSGARQASYGHPSEHYERTAAMWTAAFGSKRGWHFDAEDVPLLYMLDKISREINSASRDNLVDMAGYARVRQLILEHLDSNPPF